MLPLSLALAADLPRYEYTRPEDGDDIVSATFTRWTAGQVLFAAEPVDLAPGPSGSSVPVGIGQPLTIVTPGAVASIGGFVNAWYFVQVGTRRGWIFGAALTPFAFTDDFDGDATLDHLTVAFTVEHQIRIRLDERTLDVATSGGGFLGLRGAGVTADVIPASNAGVPLLHMYTGVEACADFSEYWISFTKGAPMIAHREVGLVDPPNCFQYEAAFSPGVAVVIYTGNGCPDDGSAPEISARRFRLVDGVYVQ